jgi:hypothetical protein
MNIAPQPDDVPTQAPLAGEAAGEQLEELRRRIEALHRLQAELVARLAALEGDFFLLKNRIDRGLRAGGQR